MSNRKVTRARQPAASGELRLSRRVGGVQWTLQMLTRECITAARICGAVAHRGPASALNCCLLLGLVPLLAACQGGQAVTAQPAATSDSQPTRSSLPDAAASPARATGFALTVSPDSFLTSGSAAAFAIETQSQPSVENGSSALTNKEPTGDVVVTISTRKAVDLRALYCDLRYDAARYTPVRVEHLEWSAAATGANSPNPDCAITEPGAMREAVGDAAEPAAAAVGSDESTRDVNAGMLTLEVLSDRGMVHLGQVLAHWDRRVGLTGDAELARVRFAAEPCRSVEHKGVSSTALFSDAIKPNLELSITHRRLSWDYYYPGDYNQDGLVGVSDLTPLALHLGESGKHLGTEWDSELEEEIDLGYAFDSHNLGYVIDGNHDGWITLNDITLIGQHFGEGISEFRLFSSVNPQVDMPRMNEELSQCEPLVTVPVYGRSGDVRKERTYFVVPYSDLLDGHAYWVRPEFNSREGTPSNAVRFDKNLPEQFWLDVQPDTYLEGGSLGEAWQEFSIGKEGPVV